MSNEALVKRIQGGERQLAEQLIAQNGGIIHGAARRYLPAARRNRAVDMDDLTQAAALGLLEAIPAWDESRGAFLTIAALYIKRSIRAALGLHTTKQRIENVPCASLDAPMEDGEDITILDTLIDEWAADPAEAAIAADTRRIVREALEALPERQYRAIQHEINGGPPAGDRHGRAAAFAALRRNIAIIRLWAEYEAAPYHHTGFRSWTYTHTSSTEAAAIRREALISGHRHSPP